MAALNHGQARPLPGKVLVCLANSRKTSGRCLAGKELSGDRVGAWIRPISQRPTHEIAPAECSLQTGGMPTLLDLVRVPLLDARPGAHQPENHLIQPGRPWQRTGRMPVARIRELLDEPTHLWLNGSSSYYNLNDRVLLTEAARLDGSLLFVALEDVEIRVFDRGRRFGDAAAQRKVQAVFRYRGTDHRLWVTDPVIERKYLARPDGRYPVGEALATISLGDPYEGYCYKLVAALLTPERLGGMA